MTRVEADLLERVGSWVDGSWHEDGHTYAIESPATGSVLADGVRADQALVDEAVSAARLAFERHRRESRATRADWCLSIADVLRGRAEDLAWDLTSEHGKPVTEARGEVAAAIEGFEVAAREALTAVGEIPEVRDPAKRILVRREPLGVWGVVTPFNFPLNIPVEYLAPAIVTGNAVVWKPAPTTSRIAKRLVQAIHDSQAPHDLVQLIVTDEVGPARHLVTHPGIVAVGFTGGSLVGGDIARRAWDKHLVLELGGNGPVVVLDDAPLERIVSSIASAAFWNAGQVCSAAGRILTSHRQADELAERLAEEARLWQVGEPLAETTMMGPLHTVAGAIRVNAHVEDAVERGGRLLTGGAYPSGALTRNFYSPTVVANSPQAAIGFIEETFGPLAAVTAFDDDDALLDGANRSGFGLVGALYTNNLDRALRVAERIECGMVVVNDTSNYWEHNLPFGGAPGKASGRGRLGGRYAIAEFTQARAICLQVEP